MKYITLDGADALYSCGAHYRSSIETADHRVLRRFYWTVARLERALGDVAEDETARRFVSRLRRHRFELCSAPLPLNWHAGDLHELLSTWRTLCALSYPDLMPHVELLVRVADELAQSDENPQLDAIERILAGSRETRTAILLKAARLFSLVEQLITQRPALQPAHIIGEYELRLPECYDQLIAIGPRHWFPDFVFTAPRAPTLHTVRYRWLRDAWAPTPAFLGTIGQQHRGGGDRGRPYDAAWDEARATPIVDDQLDISDSLWGVDWNALATRMAWEVAEDHDQEEVEAHMAILADGMAVWLEVAEDAKVLTLDLDEDEDVDEETPSQLRRISASQLQPGMFLLLRTSGGGDYIVPVADQILGRQAAPLRAMQDEWKAALRRRVRSMGLLATSIDLLDLGSRRANETNVRNWMSGRNIRPRDYADFQAIMRLVGLEDRAQVYWQAADVIDTAHRKAGFHLRKQLLKQVLSTDLKNLLRTGRVDFHLAEDVGGSLSGFRVEHVMPGATLVPASRLGRPFNLEDARWRA